MIHSPRCLLIICPSPSLQQRMPIARHQSAAEDPHSVGTTRTPKIVRELNGARLEASVRAYDGTGQSKVSNKWRSPYMLMCGMLLVVSLFEHFWRPPKWFAVVGAAPGLPPIMLRSVAVLRWCTMDVNILMLIVGWCCYDGRSEEAWRCAPQL
ncbi:cadmium/zinc-transporting ATPase HMA2-like [Triticum urartu]|uniref:cadmium/zinc-transporting ATPase HMA2-like n=1 Tax=Triticum urartu TaxID=4572 RepID=UPI0020439581|nr:cadmium/zinc-transporting ATPase HMA2-like [Triticum urartu]